MTISKGTGRGGKRVGAGRKPTGETNDYLYEPCAAALSEAVDGAMPLEFICAMSVLGAPLDAAREALGLTREAFAKKYGAAIVAWGSRQRAAEGK